MTLAAWIATGAGALAAYLLGSVPFGYLIGRFRGIDIRKQGSGNIGATNVFRVVGKPWGILAFLLDFGKGLASVLLLPGLLLRVAPGADAGLLAVTCAVAAIAGHNGTLFLGFRGGKGIATSAGALAGIAGLPVLVGVVVWVVALLLTRYVSVASIAAACALAAAGWVWRAPGALLVPVALTVLGCLAVYRHKANIQRLLAGTENRFGPRKRAGTPTQEESP